MKIYAAGNIFGKIYLKAKKCSNMCSVIRGRTGWLNFLVGVISNRRGKSKFLGLQGHPLPQPPPLVGHRNLPIRKTLRRVLGLLSVIILKRGNESIFFQSNKFTACKVKHEKEVANSLPAFNLLKIIYPFQGKKHLRT